VLAVGENSFERVCLLGGPPRFPGKAPLLEERDLPGGQIATAALACARLGLRTAYVGAVGDDRAGELALEPLRRAGIDLSGVRRVLGAASRRALVLVDRATGDRSVLERRDPRLALGPGDLPPERIAASRLLLLDASEPSLAAAVLPIARAAGTAVVLDADRPQRDLLALLRECEFPIVSEGFAEEIASDGRVRTGLRSCAGPRTRLAVATRGERGALAWDGKGFLESPAFRMKVVDTTGAGDVFHAGFAWALLGGAPAPRALRVANAAAALACRALGAQGALPEPAEIERLLKAGG
jgi:sulfofructose kinase